MTANAQNPTIIRPFARTAASTVPASVDPQADLAARVTALEALVATLTSAAKPDTAAVPATSAMQAALEAAPVLQTPDTPQPDPAKLAELVPPMEGEALEQFVARVLAPAGIDPALWGTFITNGPLPPEWTPGQVDAAKKLAVEAVKPPADVPDEKPADEAAA